MNKRGISAVVATVLIILITVAAVTIIWSAVIPMIKENLAGSDDCMKAQSEVSIGAGGYTCINSSNGNISLQVSHGPSDFELLELQVIVHVGGNTFEETIGSARGLPGANEDKVFQIANSTSQSYKNATKVEIAPVIKVGNTKKNCGVAQGYNLGFCS